MDELEISTRELIAVAVGGISATGFEAGVAISRLQQRGTREVFEAARLLVVSTQPHERRVGIDILAQLGIQQRPFWSETVEILKNSLRTELDNEVLESALIAFSHNELALEALPLVLQFIDHPSPGIRHAVVMALGPQRFPDSTEPLIKLSGDRDSNVRDWATFYLGTIRTEDSTEIREALAARLADSDFDTRSEAIMGLATRHDPRVIPVLLKELTSGTVGTLAVEAAALTHSAELLPALEALRSWWDVATELLVSAIEACRNQNGQP